MHEEHVAMRLLSRHVKGLKGCRQAASDRLVSAADVAPFVRGCLVAVYHLRPLYDAS